MQLKENSTLQSGKYRIIRVLGQGGFGITYLAENVMLGKQIAIKEFFPKDFCGRDNTSHLTLGTKNHAETVAKLKHRFLKEAQNISKLNHPGIVRIYDVFEENNTAYYVMDYIDGENLNEIVKRNGHLSEEKAVEYIIKVGDALNNIHSRNMTHFDVKPANIVIRRKDDQPILIDFGLSKQYDIHGDATSTLMQGVSQGYSPLELYNYGNVSSFSPQTDVYSLAATLYFLITGYVPPIPTVILEKGLSMPFSISDAVSSAIQKGMSINRLKRPQSILDFLDGISDKSQSRYSYYRQSTGSGKDSSMVTQEDSTMILPNDFTGLNKQINKRDELNRRKKNLNNDLQKLVKKNALGSVLIVVGLLCLISAFIFIHSLPQPFWGLLLFISFGMISLGASMIVSRIELRGLKKAIIDTEKEIWNLNRKSK